MIRLDFKLMRLTLFLYLFFVVLFSLLLFAFPDLFAANERSNGVYDSTAFYFLDFLFSFLSSASVILQLGGTFEPKTYDFIGSLPVKSTPLTRWLRSAGFFAVVQLICAALTYSVLDIGISFARMCYISFANTILFLSLALLITLLARQIFYVFCILYGYMFIDMIVGDNFFRDKSLFVNIFATFSCESVDVNRFAVYCISMFSIIVSILIIKSDIHRKMNLLR